jgi:large subunit ribosomal protein L22
MESTTYFKNLKIAPKKLRFLLFGVKKMTPLKAMDHLFYITKKPAKILYQVIKSAVNNAKVSLKVNEDLLKFKALAVDEGFKLKRYNPGARGNAKPFKRRYSHIKIVLVAMDKKVEKKNLKIKIKKVIKDTKKGKKYGTKG